MGAEVYAHLKSGIKKRYGLTATGVGDEGAGRCSRPSHASPALVLCHRRALVQAASRRI